MAELNIIVAASTNNVIGKGNDIPWKLPKDMKYFKFITFGSVVIMGRKCWDSIPPRFRPLEHRRNIVVTRNTDFKLDYPNVEVSYDLDKTILEHRFNATNPFFVIGGSEIYKKAFPFADKLYLTRILKDIEGDVYLEGFNPDEWILTEKSDVFNQNGIDFVFEIYVRKKFEIEFALKNF